MRSRMVLCLVALAAATAPRDAHAIPAWARKYNMNCSGCHSPAVPRLNAKGFEFKWAGYRMRDEIGESQEVKQLSEYLAARFRFRYVWDRTVTEPSSRNAFSLSDATLFAGGPFGKWYGGFLEFEHAADEVELVNNVYGVWGRERTFAGARVGQMHWLVRGAVAGFDRPTGITTPTPISGALTAGGTPFRFSTDELGAEAFWVLARNRLSVELLNGISPEGKGDESGTPSTKDVAAIDQFIYDDAGSGVAAVAYFGSVAGLDTAIGRTARFTRLGVTANKIVARFEAMGGYIWAKDRDLPVGTVFSRSSVTGTGWWGYAGYTLPSELTLFGRYEFVDTNRDASGFGNERIMFGGVLPVNLPEYLRLAAEYTFDNPRPTGANNRHGVAAEVMLNF